MISRKDFIKKTILVAAAASVSSKNFANTFSKRKNMFDEPATASPIVIATWGDLKATEAAMQAMKKGGTALDAVEAGARVPEADPDNTSVGYGGLPDRDGCVTLDACIMDHQCNVGSVTYLQHI